MSGGNKETTMNETKETEFEKETRLFKEAYRRAAEQLCDTPEWRKKNGEE